MAAENTVTQEELTKSALQNPSQYRAGVEHYLQQRRISDLLGRISKADDFNNVMKSVQPRLKNKLDSQKDPGPEAVITETMAQFANKPSLASPEAAKAYESELQNIDIRDLLAILFSKKDEKPISLEEAAEKEAELPHGMARFLRQERYAEINEGPSAYGAIAKRVATVRQSSFGEQLFSNPKVLKGASYALMGAIIVGTGGAAIPGMIGARIAKEVTPKIKDGLVNVKGRLDKWLVDHDVITQEKLNTVNGSMTSKFKSFMGTRTGKTMGILSGLAICAGGAILANELGPMEGYADKVASYLGGDATHDSPDVADASEAPAAEDEEIDVPNLVADTPDVETDAPEGESLADVDPATTLAHPGGGISAPGLLAATEGMQGEQMDAFRLALADMPEQMTENDLREALSEIHPDAGSLAIGTMISQAGELGLDVDQLRQGFDNPASVDLSEVRRQVAHTLFTSTGPEPFTAPSIFDTPPPSALAGASTGGFTPPDISQVGAPEAATSTPAMPDSAPSEPTIASVDEADASPDSETPTEDSEPAAAPTIDVTVEFAPGDTLSDAIWEQYKAAGTTLTAADLYAAGPLADHPGGLVGLIAEQNGIANPDHIKVGDTVQIGTPSTATPALNGQPAAQAFAGNVPPTIGTPDPLAASLTQPTSPIDIAVEEQLARMAGGAEAASNMAQHSPYNVHEAVDQKVAAMTGGGEAPSQPGQPPESLVKVEEHGVPETLAKAEAPAQGASGMAQHSPYSVHEAVDQKVASMTGGDSTPTQPGQPPESIAKVASTATGVNTYSPTLPISSSVSEVSGTVPDSEADTAGNSKTEVANVQPQEAEQKQEIAPSLSEVSTASHSPSQ